jgi:hypothetical protein
MRFGKSNRTSRRANGKPRAIGRRVLTRSEVADNERFLGTPRTGQEHSVPRGG